MNWDIWGHDWAVKHLREQVVRDRVRHAYLFTGSRGVGRRTLALRLAQAINCEKPSSPGEPCLECLTCRQLAKMQQVDLSVVKAENEGENLKIEAIREVQHSLALSPYASRFRIALFLRFEEATTQAMNALLKTLEEPAPRVVILITAESAERLLPTIVSRCEVIRMRPVPRETIVQGLTNQTSLSPEQALHLAHISDGIPGNAIYLSKQPKILEQRNTWLEDLQRILRASRQERFDYIKPLLKNRNLLDRTKFRELLLVWLPFWRDVMLRSSGTDAPPVNIDRLEEIDVIANCLGLYRSFQVVKSLERALALLSKNVNGRLLAEVTLLDLPYLRD